MNGDRFPKQQAPKAQASRGVGEMLPWEFFGIFLPFPGFLSHAGRILAGSRKYSSSPNRRFLVLHPIPSPTQEIPVYFHTLLLKISLFKTPSL